MITDLDVGGAEVMLARLMEARSACTSPVVVSLGEGGAIRDRIARAGVPVRELRMVNAMGAPLAFARLMRELRRVRPYLIQTWLYHADLAGLVAGILMRIPVVWNIRCAELDRSDHPRTLPILLRALACMSAYPAAVVSNSAAGRRAHEALGYRPRRLEIIANGFDVNAFRPSADARDALRTEMGLASDAPVVGLLARSHPMKDHDTFLRAAARVAERSPNAHFVAAGRGVAGNRSLEILVEDLGLGNRVHLLAERLDAAGFLAALDVCVSASYSEAFPNVVGEAMACGVPCVATDVGDTAEIVGEAGILVPPRQPAALADGILHLLSLDSAARHALSVAARARIESKYSLSAAVSRYDRLYAELTATPRSDRR